MYNIATTILSEELNHFRIDSLLLPYRYTFNFSMRLVFFNLNEIDLLSFGPVVTGTSSSLSPHSSVLNNAACWSVLLSLMTPLQLLLRVLALTVVHKLCCLQILRKLKLTCKISLECRMQIHENTNGLQNEGFNRCIALWGKQGHIFSRTVVFSGSRGSPYL